MMALSAPTKPVPLSLPLGFIGVGSLYLLGAVGLLALHPEVLQSYRHPVLLAVAHLFFLGFGVGVLIGVMHQLVPVILEVPLARPAWGYPALALWAVGTPLQAGGFLLNSPGWIALGGGLALLGLGVFALHMLLTLIQSSRWNPVATALAWVVVYLVLTPILGMLQALSLKYGFYDPNRLGWHALAGLGGIFLISILGVGHKLVGMFTLSHGSDEKVLGLELWAINLGLLGLALGQWFGAVLLALGVGLGAYDTLNLLKHRNKRALDVGVSHFMAGLAFLGLALGALLWQNLSLAGWWFGLGFVGLAVTGMLYKITPFLLWTHRYAPKVGRGRVPLLKEMLPERLARLAGCLLGTAALLTPLLPMAAWLYALGTALFVYTLVEVTRR